MTKIGIITGSIREERVNRQVADYVLNYAQENVQGADFEIVDIKDYDFPVVDYVAGALGGNYENDEVTRFANKINELDGYIFVTPEYNKNSSPALLNAIDSIYGEFSNKPAGLVGYGSTGAVTAMQTLRITLSNFNVATVGQFTDFNLFTDFQDGKFAPAEFRNDTLKSTLEGTVQWAKAFETIR